jgi:Flp pilus assembly protein TadG
MIRALLTRLRRNQRGATLIEFAMVAPVLLVVIMGLLDMTYRLYAKAMFEGAIQKAARDATLENGANVASGTLIDSKVKEAFKKINGTVDDNSFSFTRRNFKDFSNAGRMEASTGPGGQCARPSGATVYTYVDQNNNNVWDDGAISGQGGANDVVLYTATVTFKALSPVNGLIGAPTMQTIKVSTVLRNQPYNSQATRAAGPTRNCT